MDGFIHLIHIGIGQCGRNGGGTCPPGVEILYISSPLVAFDITGKNGGIIRGEGEHIVTCYRCREKKLIIQINRTNIEGGDGTKGVM